MDEYINREALRDSVESIDWYSVRRGELITGAESSENALYKANDIYSAIDNAPTADVAPVRHGRWIYHPDDLFPAESKQECSYCHEEEYVTLCNENYCPNCGAKIDGGAD